MIWHARASDGAEILRKSTDIAAEIQKLGFPVAMVRRKQKAKNEKLFLWLLFNQDVLIEGMLRVLCSYYDLPPLLRHIAFSEVFCVGWRRKVGIKFVACVVCDETGDWN